MEVERAKCNTSVWLELATQRKTRLKSGYKRVIINLDFSFFLVRLIEQVEKEEEVFLYCLFSTKHC